MSSRAEAKIPVIVIVTPGRNRHIPLVETLRASSVFVIHELIATMGDEFTAPIGSAHENEVIQYGRVLTPNERACAFSHLQARKIIASSEYGGVVFEDDARVINFSALESVVPRFLKKNMGKPKVLSLLDYRNAPTLQKIRFLKPLIRSFRLFAECPLAVAVALTPQAARNLIGSAQSRSQVSDWPESKCHFAYLSSGIVRHGDSNTVSTIGDSTERKVASIRNLSMKRKWRRILQKIDLFVIMWVQK